MDLGGKVAIVTGSSRGVGAATAVALAEAGCRVACAARSTKLTPQRTPGTLEDTVARVTKAGGEAVAIQVDLSKRNEVRRMVSEAVEHFGGVDILINNAAVTFMGELDQPEHRHELTFAVNYWAPYIAIQEAAPHMEHRGGGAIINVSSRAALIPFPNMVSYGASKVALEHLTLDAARILYPKRIAVNCFRIDIGVASEGTLANMPGVDYTGWEPSETPAEGMVWMLRQPLEYTGRRESMYHLRKREGIMVSSNPLAKDDGPTPTEMFDGLYEAGESHLAEPYE